MLSANSRFVLPAIAAIALLAPGFALAATVCVNTTGSGGCFTSLQAAVDAARDGDLVDIATGTYAGDPDAITVAKRLTVHGAGAGSTVVDARVLLTSAARRGDLRDLTVRGGVRADFPGLLELSRCEVTYAGPPGFDYGVSARQLNLADCVVSGFPWRGILVSTGTITRSTITQNGSLGEPLGGGIQVLRRATVVQSTISANLSQTHGAGIYVTMSQALYLSDSTVSDNHAVGRGGGIDVEDGFFTNGPKFPPGRATIRRSTIAGNTADASGGGIYVDAKFRGSKVNLEASIIADNSAPTGPDCHTLASVAALRARLGNLVENATDCIVNSGPGSPLLQLDPALGPLQNNSGPTETRALMAGSPALGVVTAASSCHHPDQRGVARTKPCDLGAYEAP